MNIVRGNKLRDQGCQVLARGASRAGERGAASGAGSVVREQNKTPAGTGAVTQASTAVVEG
jgi:hypothetical protein